MVFLSENHFSFFTLLIFHKALLKMIASKITAATIMPEVFAGVLKNSDGMAGLAVTVGVSVAMRGTLSSFSMKILSEML